MKSGSGKNKRIGKHHFRLIGKDNLYFKGEHTVSFAPLKQGKLIKNRKIIPTFNHDRKFYTYAFQLPSATPDNDQQIQQEHHKRAAQALIQQSQPMVPKPRSRHKYCGVCRGHYEDYKEHIESDSHINSLRGSRYQDMINQLCIHYRQNIDKKDNEEIKIIDLTMEEGFFKAPSEVAQTMSASRTILN